MSLSESQQCGSTDMTSHQRNSLKRLQSWLCISAAETQGHMGVLQKHLVPPPRFPGPFPAPSCSLSPHSHLAREAPRWPPGPPLQAPVLQPPSLSLHPSHSAVSAGTWRSSLPDSSVPRLQEDLTDFPVTLTVLLPLAVVVCVWAFSPTLLWDPKSQDSDLGPHLSSTSWRKGPTVRCY